MKWISVDDRLPEIRQNGFSAYVWTWHKTEFNEEFGNVACFKRFHDGTKGWTLGLITHWAEITPPTSEASNK